MRRAFILAALTFMAVGASAENLQTPFLSLEGASGKFNVLRLDGAGHGGYGRDCIQLFRLAGMKDTPPTASGPGWIEYAGVEPVAVLDWLRPVPIGPVPIRIQMGKSYGQTFTTDRHFSHAGGKFPTYLTGDSGFTLSLYRGGPGGAFIGSRVLRDLPDNVWAGIEVPPQPPGKYYLEVSDPVGTPGWYTNPTDIYPDGQAYADGRPLVDADRTIEINAVNPVKGTWRITAESSRIKSAFTADPGGDIKGINLDIDLPWVLTGYDVTDPRIPFRRFCSDLGQYLPIEQFKRAYDQSMIGHWIQGTGRGGADVRFLPGGGVLNFAMTRDTMSLIMPVNSEIEIMAQESPLPDCYPVFFSSDPKLDATVNPFYYERAMSWPNGIHSAAWFPWMTLTYVWTSHPYSTQNANAMADYPVRADGYVNSWGRLEGWPFPGGHDDLDHRQFYTNCCYIIGCATQYLWTGDEAFLSKVKDKLRKACDYMLNSPETNGREGLLRLTSKDHDGTGSGLAGSYWDDVPFGYLTAYENIYFYASLEAMANLEHIWGDQKRMKELMLLRQQCRKRYNELFWDNKVGRYIGCIDVKGKKHDYGFTYLNLEAAAYGLPDRAQVERIYHWLEKEPTSTGQPDTYSAFVFAPRVNTIDDQDWWFLNGTVAPDHQPFGTHCEQGGAILYTSFFDLMARRDYLGADNAMKRFRDILGRYALPDKLCGGNPLYYGEKDAAQVGTSVPFPESGLVPTFFVHGIIGARATTSGLRLDPHLPKGMSFAGVKHLRYHGKPLTIKAFRDHVDITGEDTGKTTKLPVAPGKPALYRP